MSGSARARMTATRSLKTAAEQLLSRRYRRECRVEGFRRRVCPYSSSYRIEELDVRLDDGREVGLVLKNLGRHALLRDARRARPAFLYEPHREIQTYRRVLRSAGLGTPMYYGAVVDERLGRYWLFLERVSGLELRHIGEFATWEAVVRWLGAFHRRFQRQTPRLLAMRDSRLVRCDAAFFRLWIDRARQNAARRSGRHAREEARRVEWLAQRYDRVVDRLSALPATIIHGEFYACNVIIRRAHGMQRICPVDWELTAAGPGLIDLAALITGTWTDEQKRRLVSAYCGALGGDDDQPRRPSKELLESLDYCRLHLAVRMLGWSGDDTWTPPSHHAHNWLAEAMSLGRKLGV